MGVHAGIMTPERFVGAISTTAARIFNIYPQKGVIAPGSDADVVVWNPDRTRVISAETHHHAVDFNIFEGMEVDGDLKVTKGARRFVPNLPFSPFVYDKVKAAEEKHAAKTVPVKRSEKDMFIDMTKPGPVVEDDDIKKTPFDLDSHAPPKEN